MHGCVVPSLLLDSTAGKVERVHSILDALCAAVDNSAVTAGAGTSQMSPQRKYSFPGALSSGNSRNRARSLDSIKDVAQDRLQEECKPPKKYGSSCVAQLSRRDAVAPLVALLCEAVDPLSTVLCDALEANASRWLPEKEMTNLFDLLNPV